MEGTRFVHTKDISSDPSKKHVFYRSWLKLPTHMRRNDIKCSVHSRKCRIVEFYAGFILHLHLMLEEHVDARDETSGGGGRASYPLVKILPYRFWRVLNFLRVLC